MIAVAELVEAPNAEAIKVTFRTKCKRTQASNEYVTDKVWIGQLSNRGREYSINGIIHNSPNYNSLIINSQKKLLSIKKQKFMFL